MSFEILVKGGTVVNHDLEMLADVGISKGKIVAVGKDLETPKGCKVVEAKGCYVIPGGIDPHCHMELPFMGTVSADDFYTGTQAALSGGTTMLMDFAIPGRGASPIECYKDYRKRADSKCCMDYGLHMGISTWDDDKKKEMETLVKEHGINSFKFFLAYKGALMVNDVEVLDILKCAKNIGAIAQVHCENGDMVVEGQKRMLAMGIKSPAGHPLSRPAEVEAEATARVARLAAFVGTPLYIVHVMSKAAMLEVAKAKLRGQRIIGETLTSALALDESHYFDKSFEHSCKYVMSPPLRPKGDQCALKKALKTGTLDLIGTDHCVFKLEQKKMGEKDFTKIPNGLNGMEDRMNICWNELVNTGVISRKDYVKVTSAKAAQIFNIYPQKGRIAVGADADIAIIDPKAKRTVSHKTHHQNLDYNVYEGYELTGYVTVTISRGRVVWENGKLTVEKGTGKFVKTPPFGYMYEGLDKEEEVYGPKKYIEKMEMVHRHICKYGGKKK